MGKHKPKEVVVLADSGYDNRNIENAVAKRKWKFVIALSKTRSVKSQRQHLLTNKSEGWSQVSEFFKNHRILKWATIRFIITIGTKKRQRDFRARQIIGYLRYVGKVQLVCSEFRKRPDG